MKFQVYIYSAIRIIIFCSLGFFISWALEDSHHFFGDTYVPEKTHTWSDGTITTKDPYWQWSGRHVWATVCSVALILLSLADMIIGTIRVVKKNYDTSKW